MRYYKIFPYSLILLILSSNICVSPPPLNGDDEKTNGGGISVPHGSLSYTIDINPSEQFRNKTVEINYKFFNENANRGIPDIVVFGRFEENFEVVDVSHCKEMSWDRENFEIEFSLGPGGEKEFIYYLRIKRDAELNNSNIVKKSEIPSNIYKVNYNSLISNNGINVAYNDNDVRLEVKKYDSKCDDEIYVQNNKPKIVSSSATIVSELHPLPNNGSLLYKYKYEPEPMQIWLNASGSDEEDENLNYTWITNPVGTIYQTNNKSHLINMTPLRSSVTYSFIVYAEDKDFDKSNSINAKVLYNNISYSNVIVTNAELEENIKLGFILFVLIIFIISFAFKYIPPKSEPWMDRWLSNTNKFRYLVLLVPVIFYILSILIAAKNCYWDQELPFYLTSLAWFEIIIFMIIFIFVILFTHNCFSQHEIKNDKITRMLWIINLVGMTTLLVSLTLIIPRIEPELTIVEHLQWYYSTMAQVFASILAIVAVFYTALPNKNIISINLKEKKEKRIEYNHPHILRRFITIYGMILGLVLLGLSSGVYIEFPIYIEFSPSSLPNLFSIILFETTLLMIPPAISSLYTLIRITAYTGTVNIRSRPSAYRIYLDKYDTGLITPAKLMLRGGDYSISLRKTIKSPETNSINLHVVHGTEIEYYFDIIKLEQDYLKNSSICDYLVYSKPFK